MNKVKKTTAALTDEELAALTEQANGGKAKQEELKLVAEEPKKMFAAFGVAKTDSGKYQIYEMKFNPESGFVKFEGKADTNKRVLTSHSIGSVLIPSISVLLETKLKGIKK